MKNNKQQEDRKKIERKLQNSSSNDGGKSVAFDETGKLNLIKFCALLYAPAHGLTIQRTKRTLWIEIRIVHDDIVKLHLPYSLHSTRLSLYIFRPFNR